MTTKDKTPVVTIDDLTYFWATDGLPVFFADREGIEDIIEDLGFSIYYLFCNIAEDTTIPAPKTNYTYTTTSTTTYAAATAPTVQTDLRTSIVKVVNNIVGRSVAPIDYQITQHNAVREAAEYNLPAIPFEMVNRLDEFFRLVDAQHGTESIVLLTFDPSKTDSSGWGILVPEQTNTSVHCNYNPDSIVSEKPQDVLIVGSVHSHPSMAAYASGTDHSDQDDFDGLHITFGWQKAVNGGATQYHIEMQMSGNSWTLKPEDVFESFKIEKEPDPKVVEWSTKVKKAYPPQGGHLVTQVGYQTPQMRQGTSQVQTTQVSTPLGTTEFKTKFQNVPIVDDLMPHIVVAEIDPFLKDIICPSCDYSLSEFQLKAGYCDCCDIPLISENDSFANIILSIDQYLKARSIINDPSIYLWAHDRATSSETLMRLTTRATPNDWDDSTEHSSLLVDKQVDYLDDYKFDEDEGFDTDLTLCCSTPVLEPGACKCAKTVLYDDITDFEEAHRQIGIYDFNGECFTCQHYFTSKCTSYIEAVLDFATNGLMISKQITECNLYEKFSSTSTFTRK
jgi:hypothetical protein